MVVKKAKPLPIECIVRGYITGSGWSEYKKQGTVCGLKLNEGLIESEKLQKNSCIYQSLIIVTIANALTNTICSY